MNSVSDLNCYAGANEIVDSLSAFVSINNRGCGCGRN
jgi:hypothetical protein